jgi:hypothetical protein
VRYAHDIEERVEQEAVRYAHDREERLEGTSSEVCP